MGKLKWLGLLLIIGIAGYFLLPRLWMFSDMPIVGKVIQPVAQKPKVNVHDVGLEGLGMRGLSLTLTLKIRNPNPQAVTVDRGDFEVYIDGSYAGQGSFPHTTIPGGSTEYVDSETTIDWVGGLKGAWNWLTGKITGTDSTLRIDGTLYVDVPVMGTVNVPVSYSEEV